jgi:uncharacterized membrane protein YkoI
MQKCFPGPALGALCFLLLAASPQGQALAQDATNQTQSPGDLSSFRTIAADTLAIVNTGNLSRAKARIKDLETSWDAAEAKLRPRNPEQWRTLDNAIDAALVQLRADKPQASASKDALQSLLVSFDQSKQSAKAASGAAASAEPAKLSVIDIIAAAEKMRAGASVLDVSFEPKDGQSIYAVRSYANGKVWDGLIDGNSGAAIGEGTVVDEATLDDEDKAELAGLKSAKITLREAIASAEKANEGRALNAGLEQVHGRAVWEILVQNAAKPQQVHIDPVTGKIL